MELVTREQRLDRLERIARLLAQPDLPAMRASREQMEKLRRLLEAKKKTDAVLANPAESHQPQADPDRNESDR